MKNPKHYTLAEEILEDLDNIFGDYDKISKADAELDNPKFAIGSKDSKEIFDVFHTRFITAIAPLAILEREKSSRLRKLVILRLLSIGSIEERYNSKDIRPITYIDPN